eukprot:4719985-Pyramimonas_sp.AAC.1
MRRRRKGGEAEADRDLHHSVFTVQSRMAGLTRAHWAEEHTRGIALRLATDNVMLCFARLFPE